MKKLQNASKQDGEWKPTMFEVVESVNGIIRWVNFILGVLFFVVIQLLLLWLII